MKNTSMPLSEQVKEVLLGSLLGDGSLIIAKGYANARFAFRHSTTQSAYFHWKAKMLQEIAGGKSIFPQAADGFGSNEKLRFQSAALPALTALYKQTHQGRTLVIRRHWLNQMTAKSLAIWWLDDGSLIGNGRKGVFCTDGFDLQSVQTLQRYLQVVWHVQTRIGAVGKKQQGTKEQYWRLWLSSTEQLQIFLRIILPYVQVAESLPKVLLLYTDPILQQRWITVVAKATGFSRSLVLRALREKKQHWQKYSE